jgi:SulP family sulfate permease
MALQIRFRPRIVDALKGYTGGKLVADVAAGITVGVVALPLAMAFAIASGLRPEAGLFTAIVAGFLISAFGGSMVQIGGPAGAFIVIVYGIVQQYGVANLLLATMFSGVLLFAMGLLRMGTLVRFIPVSIVIGFTNGIAVLIALSQIKDFLGLEIGEVPAEFFAKLMAIGRGIHTLDWTSFGLALVSFALILVWPKSYVGNPSRLYRICAKLPGTIVVVIGGTLAVTVFHLPVETIGTKFGGIPQTLPKMAFPDFDWNTVRYLFAPTITLALLGAIESLLCARVADSMTEDRHDPNQELMGQGIANIVSPLFGGFCATGTIARTVTNVRSGAVSPVSGMVHAIVLLVIVLVAAPLAQNIPLASLAAILMFVAYNMGEWHEFLRLKQFSNNYRVILLSTFILTVVLDLTVAVEVGLVLSCLFFITRVSSLTRIEPVSEMEEAMRGLDPGCVQAYRVSGSLFFGTVSKFEGLLDARRAIPRVTVLDLSGMLNLDTTGLEALESLRDILDRRNGVLVLSGVPAQPRSLLTRSRFDLAVGAQNIVAGFDDAVARARQILAADELSSSDDAGKT